jgi:predicted DNA-binding protein
MVARGRVSEDKHEHSFKVRLSKNHMDMLEDIQAWTGKHKSEIIREGIELVTAKLIAERKEGKPEE